MRRSIIVVAAAFAALALTAPFAKAGEKWAWPVRGSVLTMYANDNARPYAGGMHRGIDIAAGVGTRVVAARAGRVTFAGPLGSSGNVVAIRDGHYATSYLHLGAVSVSRGEGVAIGAVVGEVGTSGRRSVAEPHLHFGVRHEDRYVDPLSLLPVLGGGNGVVPAGPAPALVPRRVQEMPVRHPVAAPVAPRLPAGAPDRGRPLVLGGLALLALVLFGSALIRANAAVNRRAEAFLRRLRIPRPETPVVRRTS